MKKIFAFIFTLFCALAVSHAQVAEKYDAAVSMLNSGDTEGMKAHLEAWEAEDPQCPEIHALWLNYYFLESAVQNDVTLLAKGFERIDKGIEVNPDRLDFYFGKAHLLLNYPHDFPAAVALLKAMLERHKADGNAWKWTFDESVEGGDEVVTGALQDYIGAFFANGEFAYAEQVVDMALEVFPLNPILLSDKAAIDYQKGDYQGALKQYLEVLKITPDDYLVMTNVALLYDQTGDQESAREYLRRVKLSKDPEFAEYAVAALAEMEAEEQAFLRPFIETAISDFLKRKDAKKSDVFSIMTSYHAVGGEDAVCVSVHPHGDAWKFLLAETEGIGSPHVSVSYIEQDGKMFYWCIDGGVLTQEVYDILVKYDFIEHRGTGLQESLNLERGCFDDGTKVQQYYFRKSAPSQFKRTYSIWTKLPGKL